MKHSLSVLLPVYNAQSTVTRQVVELLEMLPDLTPCFEVLVVDDGSQDQTDEVVHELARSFPQLRLARHRDRQGTPAVLRTGLREARHEVVFLQREGAPVSPNDLQRLWHNRADAEAATEPTGSPLQMIRRDRPAPHRSPPNFVSHLRSLARGE